ncbi:uncharacterized protein SI:CH211-221J21.3 isoform X1 [Latimeria chalumnae]|uniref:uncharacterized protein SI:CH211-221J21.3 isoform X1 n=1 Tax=Latimeria chalumnae TaxID=7897 RepID=UPI00313E9F56
MPPNNHLRVTIFDHCLIWAKFKSVIYKAKRLHIPVQIPFAIQSPILKRFCSGLESCLSIQNGHMYSHLNNSQTEPAGGSVLKSLGESPGLVINHERGDIIQPCSRCMAGESGHINHIMGI